MASEHEIVRQVYAAKEDSLYADDFIESYKPFIRAETAKFLKTVPDERHDDELSIAMIAFYEAIQQYSHMKGAFLSFAARLIRNRLIDYLRQNVRHQGLVELDAPTGDEQDSSLLEIIPEESNPTEEKMQRQVAVEEIQELRVQMSLFNVSLTDLVDKCPKQKRTLQACQDAAKVAVLDRKLMDQFMKNKKLPITRMAKLSGVSSKTLERHRDYLIALLLIYSHGYELIRGHLSQVAIVKGEY